MLLPNLALLMAAAISAVQPAQIFVSPSSKPSNSGLEVNRPLGSLEAVQGYLERHPGSVVVNLLPGTYHLTAPLQLRGRGAPVVLRAYRAHLAILDGGERTPAALILRGSGLRVEDLTLQNFSSDGIRIQRADHIEVTGNLIQNIASTRWSTGAIHGLNDVQNIRIEENDVRHTGYSAILFEAPPEGRLSNIVIQNNHISDACKAVHDCGAIYATGRANSTGDIRIEGNTIQGFGKTGALSVGIYMDDTLSDALVENNFISGTGDYGILVHGGSNNRIYSNRVCMPAVTLLMQTVSRRPQNLMLGNKVSGNELYGMAPKFRGERVQRRIGANVISPVALGRCKRENSVKPL